jgi:cytochrome c oxidase subunit IV
MDLAHDEPNYMLIFYWLAALTALEVGVTYMGLPKMLMIAILVGLAVAKAVMVAMYFMHLKFERRTLGLIALTPPLLLVLFVCITYPDTAWRLFTHH